MSFLRSSLSAIVLATAINKLPKIAGHSRGIKRWVAPTLRELRRRSKLLGPSGPQPRSGFVEWNYDAEIYAFSKRLNEDFQLPILQRAFTERSYALEQEQKQRELEIQESELKIEDNTELTQHGLLIAKEYMQAYLEYSLPDLPQVGQNAIRDYLLTTDTLSYIALYLGMKELILSSKYPPEKDTLSNTLLAVIGALEKCSGRDKAYLFVRDFICTQLNQRDLFDLWPIENPEELLKQICQEKNWSEPEPRLLGDCGRNTVLATYHVGLFVDKKIIGKGFGEDIPTAITTASIDSLQKLFGIQNHMRPFNFQAAIQPKNMLSHK